MTPNGFKFGCAWLAASLLLVRGSDAPALHADSAPVLLSANHSHTQVVLTVQSDTATDFHIRVVFSDEGDTFSKTGFLARPPWKPIGKGIFSCKVKIPGDTNDFSVAVVGTTNFSNSIRVIP